MLLVKTANGQVEQFPYTLGDLRRENPNTSFPKKIGDAILASYGICHVMPDAQPEYDPLVQALVRDPEPHNKETSVNEDTGETYKTGRWVIGYTVENKPQDQAEYAVRNKRDRNRRGWAGETYKTGRWVIGYTVENKPQDQAEDAVRNKRDHLLSDTDWMALSDNTMSPAWATYRQALRGITAQEGFPYSVIWPTKP